MSFAHAWVCFFVILSHRFPLGLGSLFFKLGAFSAVMNGDQQLPHQQSSQAQQEDGADDRSHHYQGIRTFRTLYTHANIQTVRIRKIFLRLLKKLWCLRPFFRPHINSLYVSVILFGRLGCGLQEDFFFNTTQDRNITWSCT